MKEKYRDRALRALHQKKNQVLKRRFCGDFGAIKSKTPVSGRALAKSYPSKGLVFSHAKGSRKN
jgi:hypothetical protein